MNRLTQIVDGQLCTVINNGETVEYRYGDDIDKLAAYEDTGLTPEEVDRLNALCDSKDKQIATLQALCEEMENTAKEYREFKEYFDKLYGRNLTVGSWHLNGALEPFDNFYDKAVDEMKKEHSSNGRNG